MESIETKMKVALGEFPVVHIDGRHITLAFGKGVHVTIHMIIDHQVKEGDILPIYTEIPYANAGQTPIQ